MTADTGPSINLLSGLSKTGMIREKSPLLDLYSCWRKDSRVDYDQFLLDRLAINGPCGPLKRRHMFKT